MGKSFRCWRPRGNACAKKNSQIAKKQTWKEARRCVVNHLHASPAHGIAWKDAGKIVDDNPRCIADEDEEGGEEGGDRGYKGMTTGRGAYLEVGSDQIVVDRPDLEKTKVAMEACLSVMERACVVFKDSAKTIEQKLRQRTPRVD